MEFSLIEGLSAIGAYGIIILANSNLCNRFSSAISKQIREKQKSLSVLMVILMFFSILGISYLAAFLGYIIINSNIIIYWYLSYIIGFGLIMTMLVPQFEVMFLYPFIISFKGQLTYKDFKKTKGLIAFAICIWIFWPISFIIFMFTMEMGGAFFMTFPVLVFLTGIFAKRDSMILTDK